MEATLNSCTDEIPPEPHARLQGLDGKTFGVFVHSPETRFGRLKWGDPQPANVDESIFVGLQCASDRLCIAEQRYGLQAGALLQVISRMTQTP